MGGNGVRGHHRGSRLTGSLANPVYQKYVARIATKLAERYAKDDRVWGWQIGNEPHIQGGEDYSPSAQAAFRKWLRRKYGTLLDESLAGAQLRSDYMLKAALSWAFKKEPDA